MLHQSVSSSGPRPFRHHMLREIYEQPAAIARTLEYYLDLSGSAPTFRDEPLSAVAALLRRHPAPTIRPPPRPPPSRPCRPATPPPPPRPAPPAPTPASQPKSCSKTSPAWSSM